MSCNDTPFTVRVKVDPAATVMLPAGSVTVPSINPVTLTLAGDASISIEIGAALSLCSACAPSISGTRAPVVATRDAGRVSVAPVRVAVEAAGAATETDERLAWPSASVRVTWSAIGALSVAAPGPAYRMAPFVPDRSAASCAAVPLNTSVRAVLDASTTAPVCAVTVADSPCPSASARPAAAGSASVSVSVPVPASDAASNRSCEDTAGVTHRREESSVMTGALLKALLAP